MNAVTEIVPASGQSLETYGEEWRPVEGSPGYWVSDLGRVCGKRGDVLKPAHVLGYPVVSLPHPRGKGQILKKVHRLVCTAFHGPAPAGHEVAHLDGNRANPRADNLIWATHAENQSHKVLHGTHRAGDTHPSRKLSSADVAAIRAEYARAPRWPSGMVHRGTCKGLAERFGVSVPLITKIVNGSIWKNVA